MTSSNALFVVIITLALSLAPVAHASESKPVDVDVEVGMGYDSNVYMSPHESYIDYTLLTPVKVDPVVEDGFYLSYYLRLDYLKELDKNKRALAQVRMRGSRYLDPGNQDADNYNNKISAGVEYVLARDRKLENTLYVGPYAAFDKEVYFDRDDGQVKKALTNSADVSGSYNYRVLGVEAEYSSRATKHQYFLFGFFERRDYMDPKDVSENDHLYYGAEAEVDLRAAKSTRLDLSCAYFVRDYDDKHTYNLNGVYSSNNPLLTYTYYKAGASLRHRLSSVMLVYLDYVLLVREDNYVGYGDYIKNLFRLRTIYDLDNEIRARLTLAIWDKTYDSAFAFDDPTQEKKEFSGYQASLKVEKLLNDNLSVRTEFDYESQDSTDERYIYDRYTLMAGLRYEY